MKKETEFSRNCPQCNKLLYYKNKYKLNRAQNAKSFCQSCFAKERAKSKEYKNKLSIGVKNSWKNDLKRKENQSKKAKSFWKNLDNETYKTICQKMKDNFNYSEARKQKNKMIAIDKWKDPEIRKKYINSFNTENNKKFRSNLMKNQIQNPNSKINSKESKQKRIKKLKKNWENKSKTEKELILNKLTKTLHSFNGTSKLEKFVASKLKNLGFKHKKTIEGYCIDIVHNNLPLIVEVNGDFWHANPQIYSENWINNVTKQTAKQIWEKDNKKINILNEAGYHVIILWQKQIKEKFDFVTYIHEYICTHFGVPGRT